MRKGKGLILEETQVLWIVHMYLVCSAFVISWWAIQILVEGEGSRLFSCSTLVLIGTHFFLNERTAAYHIEYTLKLSVVLISYGESTYGGKPMYFPNLEQFWCKMKNQLENYQWIKLHERLYFNILILQMKEIIACSKCTRKAWVRVSMGQFWAW